LLAPICFHDLLRRDRAKNAIVFRFNSKNLDQLQALCQPRLGCIARDKRNNAARLRASLFVPPPFSEPGPHPSGERGPSVATGTAFANWLITTFQKEKAMISWALTFLVIAIIAAILGFSGVAGTAAWAAQVCMVVFLVLFLISFISGRRTPVA
jgi:uncharacterized membrane protein YtjA (UPF0391 family)